MFVGARMAVSGLVRLLGLTGAADGRQLDGRNRHTIRFDQDPAGRRL
jgi:hypothetical protein